MRNAILFFAILCSLTLLQSCGKDEVVAPFVPSEELAINSKNLAILAKFDEQFGDSAYTKIKFLTFTSHPISSTQTVHLITGSYTITRDGVTYDLLHFFTVILRCDPAEGPSVTLWLEAGDVIHEDENCDGVNEKNWTITDPRIDPGFH